MKIFTVGGFVRDQLLGKTPHDQDFVVVGSTPAEMEGLGFTQVGKDFPVYLHPETKDEYALARTERKSGLKHTEFETIFDDSITIEQDLLRRDLTINAIAQDLETGEYIDPFNGLDDIKNKVLRHVSEAFKEDPLRVLRLARFTAKFTDFEVADETEAMIHQMVSDGELSHLSKDRVWEEMKKAILCEQPLNFFEFMHHVEAAHFVLPKALCLGSTFPSAMGYVTEATKTFDDHNKMLCRMAVTLYEQTWLSSWNANEVKHNASTWKWPSELIEFASFIAKFARKSVEFITFNPKTIVAFIDTMSIRNHIQKNEHFLRNFEVVCNALFPTNCISAFDFDYNVRKICSLVPAYSDTKAQLATWMEAFESSQGKLPDKHAIQAELTSIRIQNVTQAIKSVW